MDAKKPETDQEIMARLRQPIDQLVQEHCLDRTEFQKLQLRQLAWQAVDVLVRTGNVGSLETNENIKRIARKIKELGVPDDFIRESLQIAIQIYKKMQVEYPGILKKYGSRF